VAVRTDIPQLLLACADEAVARAATARLRPEGEVHRVRSQAAALAAAASRDLDAIVVDAALGPAETVRLLLEEAPGARIVVLGLPGAHRDDVHTARDAGALDLVPRSGAGADGLARAVRYAVDLGRAVDHARRAALHDGLTGLANRTLFLDRLAQALRRASRGGPAPAVLFLDLDTFKGVNDSLGHQAGDALLRVVAGRLEGAVRPGDTVGRLGGDEFCVLLEEVAGVREASLVVERIHAELAVPVALGGRDLPVSASIGVALARWGSRPEDLLRDADAAMYRAKAEGKARHAIYDDAMHARLSARVELAARLREAVAAEAVEVHFQPIVRTDSGRLHGFEALCRWDIDASELVALAEETGLIVPLGRLVLAEAARRAAQWSVPVSVNVSARELSDPDFAIAVADAMGAAGAAPGLLRLEVTESAVTAAPERVRRTLLELRANLGVGADLDDFGTGTSSLGLLHRFPGDACKIDGALVGGMLADRGSHEIVRAVVGLAHNLGLGTIAEGVEEPAQLARLQAMGCELAQGHLFAPALPAEEAGALVARPATWLPAAVA
jgi:diguanylate cyclase (GGDEF)-like protein